MLQITTKKTHANHEIFRTSPRSSFPARRIVIHGLPTLRPARPFCPDATFAGGQHPHRTNPLAPHVDRGRRSGDRRLLVPRFGTLCVPPARLRIPLQRTSRRRRTGRTVEHLRELPAKLSRRDLCAGRLRAAEHDPARRRQRLCPVAHGFHPAKGRPGRRARPARLGVRCGGLPPL